MNARLGLLATLLLATTLPALASATTGSCTYQSTLETWTCLNIGSYDAGQCDRPGAWQTTSATAWSATGDSSTSAEATNSCGSWSYSWNNATYTGTYRDVRIGVSQYDDGYGSFTGVTWRSYEESTPYGSYEGCYTTVSAADESRDLGCPAGSPPNYVPILP